MRHLITLGCLAVAVVMYILGSETGAAIFFGLGGLFELAFWKRILTRRKVQAP
ncbi:MAG: hypothetical protein HY066_02950 [Betaproteobacteria bacterium]|nr:hypothetical protein [Betaproteobacteria bacterium]